MNIKKIEKQLKKINQLFETIKDDGTVSSIEKDLMLSYVRGLYEKIIDPQNNETVEVKAPSVVKAVKKEEIQEVVEIIPETNHIANVVMKEVEEADNFTSYESAPIQNEPVQAASSYQAAVVEEVIAPAKPKAAQELLDLFEFEAVSELSDKLSRSPISDLTKCMGINEKIFTVQELFGGDSALFNNAMESMDKFSSLEQARDYLVEHVAVDQNWNSEAKLKKAAHFIKLISRRY